MSSTALLKPSIAPKLLHQFSRIGGGSASIQVWTTTCIVTNFKQQANVLVNPSNPELSGVKNFPYFPKGGPVPKESPRTMHKDWQPLGYVSSWGGMDIGDQMLFPVSVVDGLVHMYGGFWLHADCALKTCPIGSAVRTRAGNLDWYEAIIHTTPPFYIHNDECTKEQLRQCYLSALELASRENSKGLSIACPLLGSGARGFPFDKAIEIASQSTVEWCRKQTQGEYTIAFGLLEESLGEQMVEAVRSSLVGLEQ
jgi:O-acetyl-ADP-ribose deacetylase (regulator of RNase III)